MTNEEHRRMNTVLIVICIVMLGIIVRHVRTNTANINNIEECQTLLYEHITGKKDPLKKDYE